VIDCDPRTTAAGLMRTDEDVDRRPPKQTDEHVSQGRIDWTLGRCERLCEAVMRGLSDEGRRIHCAELEINFSPAHQEEREGGG
jgi:hypothetical protein